MKVGGILERWLFGKEGVRRAAEAEARLEAALKAREKQSDTLDQARSRLRATVEECEKHARKIASDPPPVVRYILPSSPDLSPIPPLPPVPKESKT